MLEVRVFGVYVRQTTHLTCGALQTVVIVFDFVETIGVVEVFVSANGSVERIAGACVVDRCVVGEHINNHPHAISLRLVAHCLEIVAST